MHSRKPSRDHTKAAPAASLTLAPPRAAPTRGGAARAIPMLNAKIRTQHDSPNAKRVPFVLSVPLPF